MAGQHKNRVWWIIDLAVITITDVVTGLSHEETAFSATALAPNTEPTEECKHRCVRATNPVDAVLKFQDRIEAAENLSADTLAIADLHVAADAVTA
jgi:hypothetical protein